MPWEGSKPPTEFFGRCEDSASDRLNELLERCEELSVEGPPMGPVHFAFTLDPGDLQDMLLKYVAGKGYEPKPGASLHILLTFGEFIEKLVALIPRPKIHLVRWSGVFAPNSPLRQSIILNPEMKKGFQFQNASEDLAVGVSKNSTWASLLTQTFKFDMTKWVA
jgi:hypothetical protein